MLANRSFEQIAREILEEATETDRQEDKLYGEARQVNRLGSCAPGRGAGAAQSEEELQRDQPSERQEETNAEIPRGPAIDPASSCERV